MSVTGIKFTQLPSAGALTGAEILAMVQGGVSVQGTAADIAALGSGSSGSFSLTGVGAPSALSAGENNDWSPSLTNLSRLRVTPVATSELTGLAGGTDGRILILSNVAEEDLIIRDESNSSTEANRFALNGDLLLPPGSSVMIIYDGALARWSKFV